MSRNLKNVSSTNAVRALVMATATVGLLVARPASAQQSDSWKGSFAPLYLWASSLDGDVTARSTTVPVSMSFADAADKLAGAFSFHFEAQKGRLGIFSDLDFVRLSTESQFTIQGPTSAPTVDGDFDLDNTFFEAGGSYLLSRPKAFALIAGLRTYTLSPKVTFSTPTASVAPIDASRTAASGFAGFTLRPQLSQKWTFLSRADIGGGTGMSWSALVGVEFRPKPWGGLVFGYKALGIDVGSETDDKEVRKYDVTYYGPIFGFNLHWGGR
jgi:hypothetical protein